VGGLRTIYGRNPPTLRAKSCAQPPPLTVPVPLELEPEPPPEGALGWLVPDPLPPELLGAEPPPPPPPLKVVPLPVVEPPATVVDGAVVAEPPPPPPPELLGVKPPPPLKVVPLPVVEPPATVVDGAVVAGATAATAGVAAAGGGAFGLGRETCTRRGAGRVDFTATIFTCDGATAAVPGTSAAGCAACFVVALTTPNTAMKEAIATPAISASVRPEPEAERLARLGAGAPTPP
jgi:hypothetical protein